MKTKEETLGRFIVEFPISEDSVNLNGMTDEAIKRNVYKAMDDYAKEVAMDFVKFREKYQREETIKVREAQRKVGGIFTWIGATDEKIFNLFIQETNASNPNP